MRHRPLDSLLLAGVGTLAVHEIAYLPGSVGASVSHDHLPVMWGAGGAVAVVVLVRAVVTAIRSRGAGRSVDPLILSGAIAAFFLVQESLEHTVVGAPAISLLSEGVIWLGVAAAPVVGWLLARLVNGLVELAADRPTAPRSWPVVRAASRRASSAPDQRVPLVFLRHSMARRGPPLLSY